MVVHEIYTPPIEQSDWSEFTTMVQITVIPHACYNTKVYIGGIYMDCEQPYIVWGSLRLAPNIKNLRERILIINNIIIAEHLSARHLILEYGLFERMYVCMSVTLRNAIINAYAHVYVRSLD